MFHQTRVLRFSAEIPDLFLEDLQVGSHQSVDGTQKLSEGFKVSQRVKRQVDGAGIKDQTQRFGLVEAVKRQGESFHLPRSGLETKLKFNLIFHWFSTGMKNIQQ